MSRPSASVLPISTLKPFAAHEDVARPHRRRRYRVLDDRDDDPETKIEPFLHDEPRQRQRRRRAAHVLFHQFHSGRRLDVEAAGVECDALADERDFRRVRASPGKVDDPRLLGGRAPDRVDERKIGGEKLVAAHHADARVKTLGELDDLLLERVRPERVGRGVDKVASETNRRRDAVDPVRIDPVGRHEAGLRRRIGLEPVVSIEREKKAERREIGVMRRVGETVDAFRQRRRELAGTKRIARGRVRLIDPEQHAGERPRFAREKLHSSGLRLEAAAFGEGRGGIADRRLDRVPIVGADEPDRRRVGRRRGEGKQRSVSIGREFKRPT